MEIQTIHEKLKALNLIDDGNNPLSYSKFKTYASIHRYGKSNKILYVGIPNENLFGFYVAFDNDTNVMKESYEMYKKLVKGSLEDFADGYIQWGNRGIKVSYGNLRSW